MNSHFVADNKRTISLLFQHRTGWLFIYTAILIFIGIGLRGAWPPDEPRFVLIAKSMVETGHWLIPMRGGEIYPDKPPVFMWSIAIFYWLTGNINIAMLLPNALCSLVTFYLSYQLSKQLSGQRAAQSTLVLLLLCPQFLIQAKFAQIDAMVSCWIMIGVYGFMQHALYGPKWGWYYTAWAFMGLGIITKGVGFLPLFLLIVLVPLFKNNPSDKKIWQLKALLGPVVMCAVILSWLGPLLYYAFSYNDPNVNAYLNNILFKQTADRYANAWHHIEPWYYYLTQVIPVFWIAALAVLALHPKIFITLLRQSPAFMALFIWIILVVCFFSISPGKRGVYLLPALPAICIIAGSVISSVGITTRIFLLGRTFSLVGSFLLLFFTAYLLSNAKFTAKLIAHYDTNLATIHNLSGLLMLAGLGTLATHLIYKKSQFTAQLLVWVGVLCLTICTYGYAIVAPFKTPESVLKKVQTFTETNSQIAILDFKGQYLLYAPFSTYHFGFNTPKDRENGLAWQWLKNDEDTNIKRYIMVPESYAIQCVNTSKAVVLGTAHRERWLLFPAYAALPTCHLPSSGYVYSTSLPTPEKLYPKK